MTEDTWVTTVAVFLFALHPVHVESAAWVSGATDTLLGILVLGALLCYLKHQDTGKTTDGWYWTSLILSCVAVFTKETALIMPALIFAVVWIFPKGRYGGKS